MHSASYVCTVLTEEQSSCTLRSVFAGLRLVQWLVVTCLRGDDMFESEIFREHVGRSGSVWHDAALSSDGTPRIPSWDKKSRWPCETDDFSKTRLIAEQDDSEVLRLTTNFGGV